MIPDGRSEQPARLVPRESKKMKQYPNEAVAIAAAPMIVRLEKLRLRRDFEAPMRMHVFGSDVRGRALVVPFPMFNGGEVVAAGDGIATFGCEAMMVRADGVNVESAYFPAGMNGCRPPRPVPVRLWPEAEYDDRLALSANAFSAVMEETA